MELLEIGDDSLTNVNSLVVVQVFHLLSPALATRRSGGGWEWSLWILKVRPTQPSMMVIDAVLGLSQGVGQGAHRKNAGYGAVPLGYGHDLGLEPGEVSHHIVYGPSLRIATTN